MARIVRYTIAGMLGALVAWIIMEPTPLMPESSTPGMETIISFPFLCMIGLVSGLLIGLLIGLAEGLSGFSPRDLTRSVLMGALVGAGGGLIGIVFGNALYNVFYHIAGTSATAQQLPGQLPPEAGSVSGSVPKPIAFVLLLIGRSSGWALIGGFIGISQGIAHGSTRKMVNGAVGGLIGGALGGSVFEILKWMNLGGVANFPPAMMRMIGFAATGGAIGLFIGFIEELAKKAWLIRLIGRNEGKQYTIFKPVTTLGRSELADLPVFGDPDVAPEHARIIVQGQRHLIEDIGSTFGTSVNGQKVSREALRDGDEIVIGKTRFLFRDKATAGIGYPRTAAPAGPAIPDNQHVCPFCGAVKDANGNCDCTVGAAPAQATQQIAQPTVQQPSQPTVVNGAPSPFGEPTIPVAASPAGQGARLVCMGGPFKGQTFQLGSASAVIGRDATVAVPLSMDNTVSRNHARIVQEVTSYVIYDMGSTNGTFVNGQRITQQSLNTGDLVQIGSSKFRFEES